MNPARDVPSPPPSMPERFDRDRRAGPGRIRFSVELETTTPILGGAPATGSIDDTDFIRVPTIRGHLRFWWRALQSGSDVSSEELYAKEARLWGKAADECGGRSAVETIVEVRSAGTVETADIKPNARGSYALWPARAPINGEAARRRKAGVQFRLTIVLPANPEDEMSVRNAVRAWILFGGYGSRTRRGVGSLTVRGKEQDKEPWLPDFDDEQNARGDFVAALRTSFGSDIFSVPGPRSTHFPLLSGATLLVGPNLAPNSQKAWEIALGWLSEFRQGRDIARDVGTARPGQSRWPEADKLRHITGKFGHLARYTDPTPAWPRAEFGLPIVGRFQGWGEPEEFRLTWQDSSGKARERMSSPLIVKALPTMQGFLPCVLWLERSNPPGMQVIAQRTNTKPPTTLKASAANPGYAGNAADQATASTLKAPLTLKTSVRSAFLDWVKRTHKAIQVTP